MFPLLTLREAFTNGAKYISIRSINCSVNTLRAASDAKENLEEVERPTFLDEPEEVLENPEKFNKSRLLPQHRNMLLGRNPYTEPQSWIHKTERYQRSMFGRYGHEAGVNPRICFKTKDDILLAEELERVAYPFSLEKMKEKVNLEKAKRQEQVQHREEMIEKKLQKLEQWKSELTAKIAKKEAETLAAKERKERLIEEVRRHFGFNVDSRDERFKEMLEQKEKEDKKKQKEAKRKVKEEKMMAKLLEKNKSE